MQLVEKGEINLNEDINIYLDFTVPKEVVGAAIENTKPIKMIDFMNHTAGFEETLEQLFVLSKEDLTPLDVYLKSHIPAQVFPTGEQIDYSNYGSTLATYIVERVSGMHIFNP